jgi:hypothetical protein
MARRSSKRPWGAAHPELDVERARGGTRSEQAPDGTWTVRSVTSQDKTYLCPGCRQEIVPGTPHVVAWQSDALLGADAALELRRHWHRSCWSRRGSRR